MHANIFIELTELVNNFILFFFIYAYVCVFLQKMENNWISKGGNGFLFWNVFQECLSLVLFLRSKILS